MTTAIGEQRSIRIARDAIGNTLITGDSNVVVIQTTQELPEERAEPTAIGPNPYRGLSAFDESDAEYFFGREALTERLWELFRRLHEPPPGETTCRLLPILGPSGSGKSSLARAGLIPELARRPLQGLREPQIAVLTPGVQPVEALAAVLARAATKDPSPVAKTREFADELRHRNHDEEHDGLRRIAEALPNIAISPLIVLIDQFEETYSMCDNADERDAFVGNIMHAASHRAARVSVILTLRSDFLGAAAHHPDFNRLIASEGVIVPAMDEEDLRRAISEPASLAGHPIDEGTVDLLVAETQGREGALPLLQFVLSRVWEGISEGTSPAETLRSLNGVGGALAEAAERLYSRLDDRDKDIARRAFLAMVRLGEGARDTRRRAKLAEIVAEGEDREHVLSVLRTFAKPGERLVTLLSNESGVVTAEVTHEALFEHWQRLDEWLSTSRDDIRFHRRLAETAERWDRHERPVGLLWRPPDLDRLRGYANRARGDMTALQAEFFRASDRRQRRDIRLKRAAVLTIGVLALMAGGAAIWAELQREEADVQRANAEQAFRTALKTQSRFLADQSRQEAAADRTTSAALLALEALPKGPDDPRPYVPEAEAALYQALLAHRQEAILSGHEEKITHVAFSPDGSRVVTASEDGTAQIWNAESGDSLAILTGHGMTIFDAAYSPDGSYIVTAAADNTVRIWDAVTGQQIRVLDGHADWVWQVDVSPDGSRIVTASEDDTARVWNRATGEPIAHLKGHNGTVFQASFDADGQRIVTASSDNSARVWNAEDGATISVLTGHEGTVHRALFNPSGDIVLTASADGTARLWDAFSGEELKVLAGHTGEVVSATFSPGGRFVATASHDGKIGLWDTAAMPEVVVPRDSVEWRWTTDLESGRFLIGHTDQVQTVRFSPDSHRLVSVSHDRSARLWDTVRAAGIAVLRDHLDWIVDAEFSPDGNRVVTASSDTTARLWDATTGGQVIAIKGHNGKVNNVGFSPDGKQAITSSNDETARAWTTTDGSLVSLLLGHDGLVSHASIGPQNRRAITASIDGTARIWDLNEAVPIVDLAGHTEWVKTATFSADGSRVVTASMDKTARIWNAETGALEFKLEGHSGGVVDAGFDSNDGRVVTASDDGTARVWDSKTGAELAVLIGHRDKVVSASFSLDGGLVTTASNDGSAGIWDAASGERLHELRGHTDWVRDARFSPDGSRIVTASNDNTARVWDAATGVEVFALDDHNEWVLSAEFSPDGRRIISSSKDRTARLWDAASGSEIGVLDGHTDALVAASFSADGRLVATASRDGTARLYWVPPPLEELVEKATMMLPRRLTSDERQKFFLSTQVDGKP